MAKLPHQSTVPPVAGVDAVNKDYGDTNYSGGGGTGGSTPIVASAMKFETTSEARYDHNALLDLTDDWTLESWVKINNLHTFVVMQKISLSGNLGYELRYQSGAGDNLILEFRTGAGSQSELIAGFIPPVNDWFHVAVTRDRAGGVVKFYFNGEQLGADQVASVDANLTTDYRFSLGGTHNNTNPLDGYLAETRVWNAVKTPEEIRENYSVGSRGDETDLVVYFRGDTFTDAGPNGLGALTLAGAAVPVNVSSRAGDVVAHGLETASGFVSVDTATAPVASQVLTATGPNSATWQTPSLAAAAQGDYIHATMSTGITDAVVGNIFPIDGVVTQRGDLGVSGNRITGLKPGRSYLLMAQARLNTSPSGAVDFRWYNVTAASHFGGTASIMNPSLATAFSPKDPAIHIFTPDVETELEVRVTYADAGVDISNFGSAFFVIEIGAVQAEVTGGLEFMDIIEVGADTQTVTFGAGGDGALQRALDGDVDEAYFIEFWLPTATGVVEHSLRPNGVATNQLAASGFMGETTGDGEHTTMVFAANSAGRVTAGTIDFQAKTGKGRGYQSHTFETNQTASSWRYDFAGLWTDTTTNITSLDIFCNTAGGIKAGARFVLWRRTSANLRADSANSYERTVSAAVAEGTATTEYTTGLAVHGGSVIGVSALLQDAVTAGTVTVNVKVAGATVLSTILDTTNTTTNISRASIGTHPVTAGDEVVVEVATSGYTNAGTVTSGIVVQVGLVNSGLLLDGSDPRRTLVDSSDLLVFAGDVDGANDLINTGADATTVLADAGSPEERLGFFDRSAAALTRATDNHWRGANTVEPATAITVSAWIYVYEDIGLQWFISKRYNNASFVSPFMAVDLVMNANYSFDVTVNGVRNGAAVAYPLTPLQWHHVGGTYDSATQAIRTYLNGQLVGSLTHAQAGNIDYGASGDWVIGGNGVNNGENGNCALSDVRIASVVRPASWFEDVWRRGKRLT